MKEFWNARRGGARGRPGTRRCLRARRSGARGRPAAGRCSRAHRSGTRGRPEGRKRWGAPSWSSWPN
eukprot:58862-Alexandrium_andersonii.AAC.1